MRYRNSVTRISGGVTPPLGAPLVNCSGAGIKLQRMELNCSRRGNGGCRCVVKA